MSELFQPYVPSSAFTQTTTVQSLLIPYERMNGRTQRTQLLHGQPHFTSDVVDGKACEGEYLFINGPWIPGMDSL